MRKGPHEPEFEKSLRLLSYSPTSVIAPPLPTEEMHYRLTGMICGKQRQRPFEQAVLGHNRHTRLPIQRLRLTREQIIDAKPRCIMLAEAVHYS